MGWNKIKKGEYESDGHDYFFNSDESKKLKKGYCLFVSDMPVGLSAPVMVIITFNGEALLHRNVESVHSGKSLAIRLATEMELWR